MNCEMRTICTVNKVKKEKTEDIILNKKSKEYSNEEI